MRAFVPSAIIGCVGFLASAAYFLLLSVFYHPTEDILQILSEGQTVRHQQYGIGTVTESTTERTTIDFDSHGVKKFITSIWTAELVGDPPAGRPTKRRGRRKSAKKA
jgi:hypothetical protein